MAQVIKGYENKIMSETTKGIMKEKIVRIYNKNKKAINRDKMKDYIQQIMAKKKENQNYHVRIYTDRGWRSVKKLGSDYFDWLSEEEYLHNRKEGGQEAYKEVYFVDLYINTNF